MSYYKQESSLPDYNLFSPTFNLFYLNLAQLLQNWLNLLVLKSATISKVFSFQNSNEILNFLRRVVTFKDY